MRQRIRNSIPVRAALVAFLVILGSLAPAAGNSPLDPLTPELGRAAYDTRSVDIALDLDVAGGRIDAASVTIDAVAVEPLDEIHFDFRQGLTVDAVLLGGDPVRWRHVDDDLVILPAAPLAAGESFTVDVRYHGQPGDHPDPYQRGWWATGSEIFIVGEPGGAEAWFPVNNHPSDAALYTLELTVPDGITTVAGGDPGPVSREGGQVTTRWTLDDPIPAYLLAFAAGEFEIDRRDGPDGIRITHAWPPDLPAEEREVLDAVPEMIEVFSELFGPYPGERFGGVVVDGFGAALETEEMVIYGRRALNEETVAHELAHHWFGNSVRLERWQDIWLNEGFGRYAEVLWIEHRDGPEARDARLAQLATAVERLHAASASPVPIGNPTPDSMFDGATYNRGALALHALRGELGDDAFFGLLREWHRRHAGTAAGTDDFIALATEVAGRDLSGFFPAWLYEEDLPQPLIAAG
jgi:aminopeptidase N